MDGSKADSEQTLAVKGSKELHLSHVTIGVAADTADVAWPGPLLNPLPPI